MLQKLLKLAYTAFKHACNLLLALNFAKIVLVHLRALFSQTDVQPSLCPSFDLPYI